MARSVNRKHACAMGALLGLPDGAESRVIKAFVGNAGAFAMLLSLAATVCAKVHAYGRPRAPASFVGLLQVLAADGAVFFGLAAVFLCIARFLPRRQWLGGILACIVFGLAVVNAAYLFVAGDQISAAVVRSGVERLPDAWRILKHETSARTVGVIVLLTLLAIVVHRATRRDRGPVGSIPIGVSTTLAIMFGLISMQATQAGALQVSGLVDNGLLRLASTQGSLFDAGESASTGYIHYAPLVAKLARQDATKRLNVVVVVLESTRQDYVDPSSDRASMPNLLELAKRGLQFTQARAVVPHTSKALFSLFCGRVPPLHLRLVEHSVGVNAICVPELLRRGGYETVFMQSAVGAFEDRARAVHRWGFRQFESWETIQGEPLGYLASDDLSISKPFDEWLGSRTKEEPFFATLLTSGPHHPYPLPSAMEPMLTEAGIALDTLGPADRYRLLVRREDDLVRYVYESLKRHQYLDKTLLVVLGDHGEGFGDKGVLQHDNNFFEEGLRVPLVFYGPGVPTRVDNAPASLLDVAPTILELIGHNALPDTTPLEGRSLLDPRRPPRPHFFACYFDGYCYGSVEQGTKYVVFPSEGRGGVFDLNQDPQEHQPRNLLAADSETMERIQKLVSNVVREHGSWGLPEVQIGGWICGRNAHCSHPKAPPGGMFVRDEKQTKSVTQAP
jgi:arylsulfatase A-like enzyme